MENTLTKIIQEEKKQFKNKTKGTQIKVYCLTSDDMLSQLENKENDAQKKLDELTQRANERESKRKEATQKRKEAIEKRKQEAGTTTKVRKPRAKKIKLNENNEIAEPIIAIDDTQNTIPSWQTTQFICPMTCECGKTHQEDPEKNNWITCEGICGKWFCATCSFLLIRFDYNLNLNVFECKCMKKSVL